MKELFNINKKDKKPIYFLTISFVLLNLFWAFYSDNTWDDDCPARFQNTLNAFSNPHQFISLWNRPLFILIFAIPVQLGAWTIPVIQTFFSIISGFSLYQVAKELKLKFAYLAFPLLAFQPFVFGVSRYAMTEPLAITLICLSLFFQLRKKWNAFAICGSLLPLARMELVIFFPFYTICLLNARKYFSILILGIPGILWAFMGAMLNDNLYWIYDVTIGKEKKENRYGHQNWDTYLSRYAYVVGPVIMFFSLLGIKRALFSKFLKYYILLPFILGFFVYTLFSWKLNMGNAAGFLRNIIPISPFIAIITLAGISSWFSFCAHKSIKIKTIEAPKKVKNWNEKAKSWNTKLNNGKFYSFLLLCISVFIISIFYVNKLEIHHKIIDNKKDYSLLVGSGLLLLFSLIMLFTKRKILNFFVPGFVILILMSFTLIIEHPMANSSEERQLISRFAKMYNSTYLNDRITYVNHPWFIWSAGKNRFDPQMNMMKKDSLNNANTGSIALFETHYSHRLMGDVNQTYLSNKKEWIEIARYITPKRNFMLSTYEKVNGKEDYEKAHFKIIQATDSLNPASFFCLGNTYLSKIKNLEKAYNAFGQSVKIDSTYVEGFIGLGKTMVQKRNYKSAINFFDKGLKISPKNFNILLQKGVAQINLKQYNAAIKTLKKAAKSNKKDHNSWFYIGLAYQNQKKFTESLKSYEKSLKILPKFAEAWHNISIIQFQQKNKADACQNIKKAAKYGSASAKRLINQICK